MIANVSTQFSQLIPPIDFVKSCLEDHLRLLHMQFKCYYSWHKTLIVYCTSSTNASDGHVSPNWADRWEKLIIDLLLFFIKVIVE